FVITREEHTNQSTTSKYIKLRSQDVVMRFLQKCHFALRKPPFYPVELREQRHLRSIRLALLAQDKFLDFPLPIANSGQCSLPGRDCAMARKDRVLRPAGNNLVEM